MLSNWIKLSAYLNNINNDNLSENNKEAILNTL